MQVSLNMDGFIDELRKIVREEVQQALAQKPPERLFTIKEASSILRVSVSSLNKWKASGRIKSVKDCGKILFPESELQRIINGYKQ